MSTLDWVFAAVLLLSSMLGLWRGLVYEVLSVLGWVAAFVCAQIYASAASAFLPLPNLSEPLRYAAGFAAVFVGSAFAAGLMAWLAKKLIESVGLRPVDRLLGGVFGLLRGLILVLAVAVVAGLTPLRDSAFWRESVGATVASTVLIAVKPALPAELARYL